MRKYILLLSVFIFTLSCGQNELPNSDITYDIKIVNARIIDGTGSKPFKGNVLIKDGILVYVGKRSLDRFEADEIIDADGRYLTPGFIDTHAHGNAEMNPEFRNFWSMGVTSIMLGMDGSSAGMEDFGKWMEIVEDARPGVNIIPFVGHGTARNLSGIGLSNNPSSEELEKLARVIDRRLKQGAFGVSTGIEYIPGRFADREELALVGSTVHKWDGLVMSHVRNEDRGEVKNAIRELIDMGEDSGVRVHVSHIKVVYGKDTGDAERVLAVLDSARAKGISITADVYPYTASFTGIGILYPEWALPPNEFNAVVRDRRLELATHLRERVMLRNGPEATLIGTPPWAGRTLAEIADELNMPFEDVLIDHLPPGSASAAYFVMNMDVMRRFLLDEHVVVSSDGSPVMRHPRGYGAFARIIRQFVVEEASLPLVDAIHKMTGQSASLVHLDKDRSTEIADIGSDNLRFLPRGVLRQGFAADVLIFDPKNVMDHATFEEPHQYATGFDHVIVNGILVQKEGVPTGFRPGLVLRAR